MNFMTVADFIHSVTTYVTKVDAYACCGEKFNDSKVAEITWWQGGSRSNRALARKVPTPRRRASGSPHARATSRPDCASLWSEATLARATPHTKSWEHTLFYVDARERLLFSRVGNFGEAFCNNLVGI